METFQRQLEISILNSEQLKNDEPLLTKAKQLCRCAKLLLLFHVNHFGHYTDTTAAWYHGSEHIPRFHHALSQVAINSGHVKPIFFCMLLGLLNDFLDLMLFFRLKLKVKILN